MKSQKTMIHVNRGSILIENPRDVFKNALRVFDPLIHEYRNMYLESSHDTIVTLPGYVQRILGVADPDEDFVCDHRVNLPPPNQWGLNCVHEMWLPFISDVVSKGGIISIPDVMRIENVIAAILLAYPHSSLIDRGTPLSVVACNDIGSVRRVEQMLARVISGHSREIGREDSDDIAVIPYSSIKDINRTAIGVFIGLDIGAHLSKYVEDISSIRNAGRWGIVSTPIGGHIDVDIVSEGLFGQLSSQSSYSEAIENGLCVPITVCWLPCPRPQCNLGYAPANMMEAIAHNNNPAFVKLVADILDRVSNTSGCLVKSDTMAICKRLSKIMPDIVCLTRKDKRQHVNCVLTDISSGVIRKAILSDDVSSKMEHHDVLVMVTGRGKSAVGEMAPVRIKSYYGEKTYIIDFSHDWDTYNGRPGRLSLNDEARRKRYQEIGFNQIKLSDISMLPF